MIWFKPGEYRAQEMVAADAIQSAWHGGIFGNNDGSAAAREDRSLPTGLAKQRRKFGRDIQRFQDALDRSAPSSVLDFLSRGFLPAGPIFLSFDDEFHQRTTFEDYAERKSMELSDVERWLAPNLGYEP